MASRNSVQLLVNDQNQDHGQNVTRLLGRAIRFECIVAFAKTSVLKGMMSVLEKALGRGLDARFAVGLSLYQTEPDLLRALLKLGKKHSLKLYLSACDETFHPKIYAFQAASECSVLVGSANLTQSGFSDNYEASALINDPDGRMMETVTDYFNELIASKILVPATKSRIDAYEHRFVAHNAWREIAKKQAEKLSRTEVPIYDLLCVRLELLKADDSNSGFDAQTALRRKKRRQALAVLNEIAAWQGGGREDFLHRYDTLIGFLHSGGLHRGKTRIARYPGRFVTALVEILRHRNESPEVAFEVLRKHFGKITGAGVNLLTEVLHALDNKRFAVMNQNAVSGMICAGINEYPRHPSKQGVNGHKYARYCEQANGVRQALGLADFTELDTLFNYVYWE